MPSFPRPADDDRPPPRLARRALDPFDAPDDAWDDEEDDDADHEDEDDETDDEEHDEDDDDARLAADPNDLDDGSALDEDFPLGDGVADRAAVVYCPYCGEPSEVAVDPGGGADQEYVEDCPVCCRPWRVSVVYHADGSADVVARTDDE